MGVKDLFKMLKFQTVDIKHFKKKCIAIDAMYKIHQACVAHKNINLLSSNGHGTLYLQVLLQFILKLERNETQQVWIFDSPGSVFKEEERKRRRALREEAKEKGDERMSFVVTDLHVNNMQKMLTLLGVPWCVAPENVEAEQFASYLCKFGAGPEWLPVVDCVWTSDADAMLFGATNIVRKSKTQGKLDIYCLQDNLDELQITSDDLIKVGLLLGTDFAQKTPRIGIKTVLKKFNKIELSPEQETAMQNVFKKKINAVDVDWHSYSEPDYDRLCQWLTQEYEFTPSNLDRILQKHSRTVPDKVIRQ